MEKRLTPAWRYAASRPASADSGFASSVTSACAVSAKRERTAATTSATRAGSHKDGVPPPR